MSVINEPSPQNSQTALQNPESKFDARLAQIKSTLTNYQDTLGRKKLDLFFSPTTDSQDGWHTTKMVIKEGREGEIILKKMLFLDFPGKDTSIDKKSMDYLSEYDSKAFLDAHIMIVECTIRQAKGRTIYNITTIAPAEYIFNSSQDPRSKDFSTAHDPEFQKLVPGGLVTENVFISPQDNIISRAFTAHMDMEPSQPVTKKLEENLEMGFDFRDLIQKRKMRRVQRKIDGSLVVEDGYLDQTTPRKEFFPENTRIIEQPSKN